MDGRAFFSIIIIYLDYALIKNDSNNTFYFFYIDLLALFFTDPRDKMWFLVLSFSIFGL